MLRRNESSRRSHSDRARPVEPTREFELQGRPFHSTIDISSLSPIKNLPGSSDSIFPQRRLRRPTHPGSFSEKSDPIPLYNLKLNPSLLPSTTGNISPTQKSPVTTVSGAKQPKRPVQNSPSLFKTETQHRKSPVNLEGGTDRPTPSPHPLFGSPPSATSYGGRGALFPPPVSPFRGAPPSARYTPGINRTHSVDMSRSSSPAYAHLLARELAARDYAPHVDRNTWKPRLNVTTADDSSEADVVRVDVNDFIASTNTAHTVQALETCKREIIGPFSKLLAFVGWRPIGFGYVDSPTLKNRILNAIYLIVIFGSMLFAYVYQIVACQWKLDVKEAIMPSTFGPSKNYSLTTVPINIMNSPQKLLSTPSTLIPSTSNISFTIEGKPVKICQHLISTYIIPNLLHLIAYIIGFYHFRLVGSENIYALMEKVFQYCSTLISHLTFQIKVMRKLKLYLALGIIWVLAIIACTALYTVAFRPYTNFPSALQPTKTLEKWYPLTYTMFVVYIIGSIIISVVSMSVIYNYVVHCELVIFYADALCDKLQMRSLRLKVACGDMLNIKNSVRHLNGAIGVMTAFVLTVFLEMIIIGSIILVNVLLNESAHAIILAYRIVFVINLIPIFLFPLIQAARVNSHCTRFQTFAIEMRTFGYLNASQDELDSFLLFTMSNKLYARLFQIPIKGSYLIVITFTFCFVFLILFQTGLFKKLTLL